MARAPVPRVRVDDDPPTWRVVVGVLVIVATGVLCGEVLERLGLF
jgi:hypothetical protein